MKKVYKGKPLGFKLEIFMVLVKSLMKIFKVTGIKTSVK